eukprot:m.480382 g.480382  ORF g.480382 m.480382 type:complete len:366 (+) comp21810_c0_seq1:160-1257(+)
MMAVCRILVVLVSLALACASATSVTINNTKLHHDVNGAIMDAHDGNIIQFTPKGPFYFYAMSYGDCHEADRGCGGHGGDPKCGFRTNHNVSVWSSPTLADGTWTYLGSALPVDKRPEAIYYRPKIKFNSATKKYVLWTNAVPASGFSGSFDVVATSDTPQGPFEVQNANATLNHPAPGDFDLFVDDDNTAYLIYTVVTEGHRMTIEKLAPDWLTSTHETSGFIGASFVESPALFKRKGIYYALFGHCCCFCQAGSGIGVYTSSSPLGPYSAGYNIGCDYNGTKGPFGCGVDGGFAITQAQQNCVFQVQTSGGAEWLWTGDRWQSAADKIKAHDFQYWTPLMFNDSATVPTIAKLQWIDSFTLEIE